MVMNLNKYFKSTSLWIQELCLCCWSVQFTVTRVFGASNLPWHVLLVHPIYRGLGCWSVQFTVVWVVGVSNLPWRGLLECPIYRDMCNWCVQFTVACVLGVRFTVVWVVSE